jgi:hypothetical protein
MIVTRAFGLPWKIFPVAVMLLVEGGFLAAVATYGMSYTLSMKVQTKLQKVLFQEKVSVSVCCQLQHQKIACILLC